MSRPPVNLAIRFWRMVDKNGPIPEASPDLGPCWIWTGTRQPDSYGRMLGLKLKRVSAHRVAFFLQHGRWPDPCALHRCDNKACVRWSHLFEGTNADNCADKISKGRDARGEKGGGAKLTSAQVAEIRFLRSKGALHKHLATAFGVHKSNISYIVRGITWKSAVLVALLSLLSFGSEIPNAPSIGSRKPIETYPADERLLVHNSPSAVHSRDQQRIFDWSFVLGHSIYAGATAFDDYETAKNLGTCAFEGNPDLGSNPSVKRIAVHGAVEFGAVLAADAAFKWLGRRQGVPRWLNQLGGNLGAVIGTGKHTVGAIQWVNLCR